MSTKPKSQKRIERAKRKYKVAEEATDSLLTRLVASKWTLGIIIGMVSGALLVWAL